MRPTICSLFEPHYKQNLYTNPKRTAKSSSAQRLIDTPTKVPVQKPVSFQRNASSSRRKAEGCAGNNFSLKQSRSVLPTVKKLFQNICQDSCLAPEVQNPGQRGAAARPVAKKDRYSRFVTGMRPSRNGAISRVRAAAFVCVIVRLPAGIGTVLGKGRPGTGSPAGKELSIP